MTSKALILTAQGKTAERVPIWFLRQAGRFLPEYRELRGKHDFLTLCQNPALAANVTLMPLRRFDLDAAIVFSDILIPPLALGQKLSFAKDHGPVLFDPVRSDRDISRLRWDSCAREWGYVGEAIALAKQQLGAHQAMIGFAGAPFTVATYMIEGGGSKTLLETKKFLFKQRDDFRRLISLLAETTIRYLNMQVDAGAEVVMLFDTWAHQLGSEDYKDLVLGPTESIVSALKTRVPVIYYPGQGSERLWELGNFPASVIAVDWRTGLKRAKEILQNGHILQGNLDPAVLMGSERFVRERSRQVLQDGQDAKLRGHIFNVGHGLLPQTPPEALTWVIDEVRLH